MSSATGEAAKSATSAQACHHFTLAEIQSATNDFDDELVIGRGGFGKVYRGRISMEETSHVVAIKRLDSMSNQGATEFRTEIEMLSKLRHCHLVSLIGFSDDNKEMILVYEYMPHGTLHDHLHKADTPLSWVQRLKIAIGAGRGLDYLHTGVGTQHGVIHRDVKSSNILLDERWAARISDFGLSKVGPTNQSVSYVDASVKGTFGYLDPEYFYTRKLTRKTDVFAFGVVLFELLSGRLPVDERLVEEECSLVRWAKKCVKSRKLDQMVDPSIRGTILPKCLRRFAQIADRCLYSVPKERPSMSEVVGSLQVLLELEEKRDDSAESSGIMGFTWKIHKYLVPTTKQNSAIPGVADALESTIRDAIDDSKKVIPVLSGEYSDPELKPVGILEVKLVQAQGLTNKGIIGKSDPFAELYIRPLRDRMKRSKVINNDLNPIWNEHFEFVVEDISAQQLTIKLYDDGGLIRASELLGCAQVQLNTLDPVKVMDVWINLVKHLEIQRDDKDRGKVHLELMYCPFDMENGFANPFSSNSALTSPEKALKNGGHAENVELVRKEKSRTIRGVLSITVISAEDLPPTDLMGKLDPFVVLTMKKTGTKNKTRVVNESLNPVWNQTFDYVIQDGQYDMLVVEVYDHDTFGKEYIGRCILTLTRVLLEGEYKDCFPLDGAKSGKLYLNLKWTAQPSTRLLA